MHKKHIFLNIFQKITIFACVFCAFSAWADTTCDTNFTPIMGNSIQNGTPTPTTPVEVVSVGNKTANLANFDDTVYNTNYFSIDKSTGTLTGTGSDANFSFWLRSVKANTIYTISANYTSIEHFSNFQLRNSNNIAIENGENFSTTGIHEFSFSIPSDGDYRVNIRCSGNASAFIANQIQIREGSTPTSYVPYGYRIPGTSIYLDEPLRKVGDYADELRPDGTVIRRVGVKVLDGTEDWVKGSAGIANYTYYLENESIAKLNDRTILSTHFLSSSTTPASTLLDRENKVYRGLGVSNIALICIGWNFETTTVEDFKSWLAQQYANGTPVTVYYPLATPVVEQIENWSCIPPITDIQIATTKFVDDEFAAAEANLAATVQTIESVVSRTIAQTGQIATLQETKQTRPDETCPANMKCLLVQDEDGTPHWYPIIEP